MAFGGDEELIALLRMGLEHGGGRGEEVSREEQ